MGRSVGVAKAVTAEVPVVMELVKITAVAVFGGTVFIIACREGVIAPLPDQAADKAVA